MNFRFTAFLFVGVVALVVALLIVNLTDAPPRAGAGLLEPLALAGVKPAGGSRVRSRPRRGGRSGRRASSPAACRRGG